MAEKTLRCRLCDSELQTVDSGSRACCLNATPIEGICPNHGPIGAHHVK